jgi:hypothetical protein
MRRDDEEGLSRLSAALLAAERRSPAPPAGLRRSIWWRTRRTLVASGMLAPGLLLGKAGAAAVAIKIAGAAALVGAVALGVRVLVVPSAPVSTLGGRTAIEAPRAAPRVLPPPEATRTAPVAAPDPPPLRPSGESALARERLLVDRARAALAAGTPPAALRLLERHRREFPSGFFVEERDAMLIISLARSGRGDQARQQALDFGGRFPRSVFSERIAAALARP